MPFRLGHRPALDGVRGLAILTVMGVHTGGPFLPGGFLSVDVFFVLSGFLITSVIVEEKECSGTIDLGRFYLRRALRLLPGLSVLLATLGLWSLHFPIRESARELWREIFFTFSYVANWALAFGSMQAMGLLGHAWTLAIEEQFYLLWPILTLAILRRGASLRTFALLVAAAIAGVAVHRAALWHQGAGIERLFFGFDTRADSLLAGCLAALVARFPDRLATPGRRRAWLAAGRSGTALLALLLVVAEREHAAMYLGGFTVVALCAGLMLLELVDHPDTPMARAFACRPLAHVGYISYGLYLWHWPVFLSVLLWAAGWSTTAMNLSRFAITFVLAQASSILVEQPFLRLKSRWRR